MKKLLAGLITGAAVGVSCAYLFNYIGLFQSVHTNPNINLFAGGYGYRGDYSSISLEVTEILTGSSDINKREFKGKFFTGNNSCVGQFQGFGKFNNSAIVFETLDKNDCKIKVKPIEGFKYIDIETEGKCSDFSGASCGFDGKLEREAKFNYFLELEGLATQHPLQVLKSKSASIALTELMGADYNNLFDRMIGSQLEGNFNVGNDLYCAEGIMPGSASDNKAIFCLDYKNGQVQAAVMQDGRLKTYSIGKIWDDIASFVTKNSNK